MILSLALCDEFCLFLADELLLNRQVKDYSFLANGCVTVDDVDDADMFKQTEVSTCYYS